MARRIQALIFLWKKYFLNILHNRDHPLFGRLSFSYCRKSSRLNSTFKPDNLRIKELSLIFLQFETNRQALDFSYFSIYIGLYIVTYCKHSSFIILLIFRMYKYITLLHYRITGQTHLGTYFSTQSQARRIQAPIFLLNHRLDASRDFFTSNSCTFRLQGYAWHL